MIQIHDYIIEMDLIHGGKADKKTPEDLAILHNVSLEKILDQIEKGIKIEREHTDNDDIAREIAMDHIEEAGFTEEGEGYYDLLKKMEKKFNESIKDKAKIVALGGTAIGGALAGELGYKTVKELYPGLKSKLNKKKIEKSNQVKESSVSSIVSDPVTVKNIGKIFAGAAGASLLHGIINDQAEKKQKKFVKHLSKKYGISVKENDQKDELEDDEVETYDYGMTQLPKRSRDLWNANKSKEKEEMEKKYGPELNTIRNRIRSRMGLQNSVEIQNYINEVNS